MVVTRNSLPSAAEDETPPPVPNNRRAINALKKLRIAGKRTLIGDKKEEDEQVLETYHYRGGIYARTAKTPSHWVENQPMRYRKQTSEMRDTGASEAGEEEEEEGGHGRPVRKRARGTSLGSAEEPTPKRTRRVWEPEAFNALSPHGTNSVGEETPRRTRRSLPEVYYGRPKRQPGAPPSNTPKKQRRSRAEDEIATPNSVLYDYAAVGGRDEKSCQQAARDRAIYMGWEVAPIENKFRKNSAENMTTARAVAKKIARLIHVNAQLEQKETEVRDINKQLEPLEERQKQKGAEEVADGVEAQISPAEIPTQPPEASNAEPQVDTPRARTASPTATRQPPDPQAQTSPSSLPKPSEQSNPEPSLASTSTSTDRHDSAASFSPSIASKIPSLDQEFADPSLPEKNATGQRLRWSLPTTATNDDRAEAGIHRGRLEGESRSARRRRIKREHKLMRGWEVKTETETSAGGSQPGDDGVTIGGVDESDGLYHRD